MFHYFRNCLSNIMPIGFAMKIVRLKVYMTIANPMTLTFIQGHKCVSNLTTFLLEISWTMFKLFHSKLMAQWQMALNLTVTLKMSVTLCPSCNMFPLPVLVRLLHQTDSVCCLTRNSEQCMVHLLIQQKFVILTMKCVKQLILVM